MDARLLESTSPDRYKFHDLLRVYASERAVADLSEPARDAAIARLLELVHAHRRRGRHGGLAAYRYNMPLDPAEGCVRRSVRQRRGSAGLVRQ